MEATVMASPRAVSRPTALLTRFCSCTWSTPPAVALSMATETVSRSTVPTAPSVVVTVLPTALLEVVEDLS
jgi:hypothetical protein